MLINTIILFFLFLKKPNIGHLWASVFGGVLADVTVFLGKSFAP